MNILYISHKVPYPLFDGGRLRVFNHIKHLSQEHNITSLSFIEDKNELENIDELRKICSVNTITRPKYRSLISSFLGLLSNKPIRVWFLKDRRFDKKARVLSKEADLIIIQALRMTQYSVDPKKTIVDIVDTPSLQIKRALKHDGFIWKIIWALELPRIIKYEKMISSKFKNILVASKPDRKALGSGIVLKNGIEISKINRQDIKENSLMFLGNMAYSPNIDAVEHFIKDIFPLIKKEIKNVKFYIVGINPGKLKKYASEDIIFTGFVNDPNEYFSTCKIFVAPLRLGSGIQNKILEALNKEIPIITTTIVNQGVEAEQGKEIIIADNSREFADKTIILLKNQKLQKTLSSNGKNFLEKNYSWNNINRKLDTIVKRA